MLIWFIWLVIGTTIVDGFAWIWGWSSVKKYRYYWFGDYIFWCVVSNSFWIFIFMMIIKLVMWVFS